MDQLAAAPQSATKRAGHRWIWPVAVASALAVLFVLLFGLGRIIAVYESRRVRKLNSEACRAFR
jgi:hypothetical protein